MSVLHHGTEVEAELREQRRQLRLVCDSQRQELARLERSLQAAQRRCAVLEQELSSARRRWWRRARKTPRRGSGKEQG